MVIDTWKFTMQPHQVVCLPYYKSTTSPDQVSYIVNHAKDKVLCVDLNILPLVEKASENFNLSKQLL